MIILRPILFREIWKNKYLQPLFQRLYYWSLWAMNYGGGGEVETSGEQWLVETYLSRHFRSTANSKPIIFDVGANVGRYSMVVQKHLPSARIFAFEPLSEPFRKLESFFSGTANVKVFNLGVSDSNRSEIIYNYRHNDLDADVLASVIKRLPTQHGKIEVAHEEQISVISLDEFCKAEGIDRIDLLKIDIEGHELSALKGAKNLLKARAIEFIQFEISPATLYARTTFYDFWELLADHFEIYRLLPKGMVRIPFYEEQYEIYLTTNYVAKRK